MSTALVNEVVEIVGIVGFFVIVAIFVATSRLYKILKTLQRIDVSMKEAVNELKFSRAALDFMKKAYSQQLEDAEQSIR